MSEKTNPIVAHVLYVAEQHHPWQLAPIERLVVRYHTATTVFLDFGTIDLSVRPIAGRNGVSKQHYHVWCLPDQEAWEQVQAERARFQAAIDALAAELHRLGRYADRLVEAGGIARASNPLVPTVISAPDPDVTPKNWFTTHPVPQLVRRVVISHTAKMLRCQASYNPETEVPHHQREHFVCPTDADWEGALALHQAALDAEQRWNALLGELGTYRDALADQRYADRAGAVAAPAEEVAPLVALSLIESYRVDETDLDAALLEQLQAAGYRWGGAKCTPDGHWHHVVTLGTQGFRARCERLLSLITSAAGTEMEPQPQAIMGVVMMDEGEARACVARIHGHLESARRELLDLHDREGWKALGYASWRACAVAEFGKSSSQVYRLLSAAQIERAINSPIGESPESHLRPLTQLDTPEERRAAWDLANECSEQRTAADVQQAVDQVKQAAGVETAAQIREIKRRVRAVEGTYYGYDPAQGYHVGLPGKGAQHYQPEALRRELERREQEPNQEQPTSVPLTPEARDADGSWFWASTSATHPTAHHWRARPTEQGRYVSACGIEMDSLPTTGAQAGHCSVCERNAPRRETIPIPLPAGVESAPDAAPTTDAGRVVVLRDYLEQQRRAGLIYRSETADTAWRMASDIHDGDTYRSMAREIDQVTSRNSRPPAPAIVAAADSAAELPSNAGAAILDEEAITPSVGSETSSVVQIEAASSSPNRDAPASIPIGVYAPAVTLLTAIRTALLTNQGVQALASALELVRFLADGLGGAELAEMDNATTAALAVYRQEQASVGR